MFVRVATLPVSPEDTCKNCCSPAEEELASLLTAIVERGLSIISVAYVPRPGAEGGKYVVAYYCTENDRCSIEERDEPIMRPRIVELLPL